MLRNGLFPAHPCLRCLYSERVTGSAVVSDVSGADMVDCVLSEKNAPRWDFTEDAEETGAVGKFNNYSLFFENDESL